MTIKDATGDPIRRLLNLGLKLALAGLIGGAALFGGGRDQREAEAAFHFMVIEEIMAGVGGDPNAQYIELRMYVAGQNFVAGHLVEVYDSGGTMVGSFTFAGNVANGTLNSRILIATPQLAAQANVTADLPMTAVLPAAGMVCFDPLSSPIDCVAYGGAAGNVHTGPPTPLGPGDGTNALRRDYDGGGNAIDTNNTSTDFNSTGLACPTPQNNAGNIGFNNDENFIDLPTKPYDDLTAANSDTISNVCGGDTDDDNDGLLDVDELSLPAPVCPAALAPTLIGVADSDGDRVLDNAECVLGTDPNDALSKPPAIVPPDADVDGLPDALDPNDASIDSDGDAVRDGVEFRNYNTDPTLANTDGDLCRDQEEIASINGDSTVNSADLSQVAQAFGNAMSPQHIVDFDTNKDTVINSVDLSFVAQRFGACP